MLQVTFDGPGRAPQREEDVSWLEDVADLPAVDGSTAVNEVDGLVQELIGLPQSAVPPPPPPPPPPQPPRDTRASPEAAHACPLCHEQHPRISRFWGKLGYDGPAYCWRCAETFKLHLLTRSVQSDRICQRDEPCLRCVKVLAHFRVASADVFATVDAVDRAALARQQGARAPSDGSTGDSGCGSATTQLSCPMCGTGSHAELGQYWRSMGYRGPAYCSGCSNTFRNHLIRRRGQPRTRCSRESPCNACSRILEHFEGDHETAFASMDTSNQRAAQRASARGRAGRPNRSGSGNGRRASLDVESQDTALATGSTHDPVSVPGRTVAAAAAATAVAVASREGARLGRKRPRLKDASAAPAETPPCGLNLRSCAAAASMVALAVALVSLVAIGGTSMSRPLPQGPSAPAAPSSSLSLTCKAVSLDHQLGE